MSFFQMTVLTSIFGNVLERVPEKEDRIVPGIVPPVTVKLMLDSCKHATVGKGDPAARTALPGLVAKLLAGEAGPGLRSLGSRYC